jgi:hypothetical protein
MTSPSENYQRLFMLTCSGDAEAAERLLPEAKRRAHKQYQVYAHYALLLDTMELDDVRVPYGHAEALLDLGEWQTVLGWLDSLYWRMHDESRCSNCWDPVRKCFQGSPRCRHCDGWGYMPLDDGRQAANMVVRMSREQGALSDFTAMYLDFVQLWWPHRWFDMPGMSPALRFFQYLCTIPVKRVHRYTVSPLALVEIPACLCTGDGKCQGCSGSGCDACHGNCPYDYESPYDCHENTCELCHSSGVCPRCKGKSHDTT